MCNSFYSASLIKSDPEVVEWYIKQEERIGATFNKKYSWAELVEQTQKMPEIAFTIEDDKSPFCSTAYGSCTEY